MVGRNFILDVCINNHKLQNILIKDTKYIKHWTILREKAERDHQPLQIMSKSVKVAGFQSHWYHPIENKL